MKKFDNKKQRRKGNYLDQVETILIFSEGTRTEPNYFDGFKNRINKNAIFKNSVIVETYGLGTNTVKVVEEAKNYVDRNHITSANVWCVYDKDDYLDSDFNKADELCRKYTKENLVFESAWSNQSIEFWFVLHFAYYTSDNDRTKYIDYLNGVYNKHKLGKYRKADESICDILEKYGKPKDAIKYAEKILKSYGTNIPSKCKPATKVHMLIKQLVKYLPNEYKILYMDQ